MIKRVDEQCGKLKRINALNVIAEKTRAGRSDGAEILKE